MSLLLLLLLPRGKLNSSRRSMRALRRGLQGRGSRLAGSVLREVASRCRGGLWGCVGCRNPCCSRAFEAGCPASLVLCNDAAACLTKQALQTTVHGRCWRSCCYRKSWGRCWGRCWRRYLYVISVRQSNTCIATLISRVLLVSGNTALVNLDPSYTDVLEIAWLCAYFAAADCMATQIQ